MEPGAAEPPGLTDFLRVKASQWARLGFDTGRIRVSGGDFEAKASCARESQLHASQARERLPCVFSKITTMQR